MARTERTNKVIIVAGCVFIFVAIGTLPFFLTENSALFNNLVPAVMIALATYLVLDFGLPLGSDATGTVYSECSGDTAKVMFYASKYTLRRKPFTIFIDGNKMAEIYRGRELTVPLPKDGHEVKVTQYKNIRTRVAENMDIHDGLALFIGYGIRMQGNALGVEQISGNRDVFEDRAKHIYKKSTGVLSAALLVIIVASVVQLHIMSTW